MIKDGISVVIPVHNEEKIIRRNTLYILHYVYNNITKYPEIIIVDNGSNDRTGKLAKELAIRYEYFIKSYVIPRRDLGLALKIGILHSSKPIIVYYPIDLEPDINFIRDASLIIYKNLADIVVGRRVCKERKLSRNILSILFKVIVSLIFNMKLMDYNTVKAFSSSIKVIAKQTFSQGLAFESELLYRALKHKYRIVEYPVVVKKSKGRRTRIKPCSDSIDTLISILVARVKL